MFFFSNRTSSSSKYTAQDLRNLIGERIIDSLEIRRGSINEIKGTNKPLGGNPSEDEIDDFICHNMLFDAELAEDLLDPGFLGFSAKTSNFSNHWLLQFESNVDDWAASQAWQGGDEAFLVVSPFERTPTETQLWIPSSNLIVPKWIQQAPPYIMKALDLLKVGKLLSELSWRDFESLIGALLENDGWTVKVTQQTRDGGIDVFAIKEDSDLGMIKSVWQAKKHKESNKVKLSDVRELSAVREAEMATKAVIVTTSYLTKDAIDWVKRDMYRLNSKNKDDLEHWLQKYM
jgi:restriction system protein